MEPKITIGKLDPNDKVSIAKISGWYFQEWNTPVQKTIRRLTNQPSHDTILQVIATVNGALVATGGLCNEVNIYNKHPALKKFNPWIALLYT